MSVIVCVCVCVCVWRAHMCCGCVVLTGLEVTMQTMWALNMWPPASATQVEGSVTGDSYHA